MVVNNMIDRDKTVAFRATGEFIKVFDDLSITLGCNRSELIRYALKGFARTNLNNVENQRRVREELY